MNATIMGIDAQNNLYLAYNVANYGKLYRSTNSGSSWSVVSNALNTNPFFSFCATASGQVYVAAPGVYQTTDGGDTWNDLNVISTYRKPLLSFTAAANNMLYVAIQGGGGVWRSDDNGIHLATKDHGADHSIQIATAADGSILYNAFINGSSTVGVIFRSTNNGDTWTQVASNGTDLYTKSNRTAVRAKCGLAAGLAAQFCLIPRTMGPTGPTTPIPNFSAIWDIEFGAGNTIFLGSESEGVSRSTDGGIDWEEGVGNSIPWYGNVIEVEMDHNGYLFAATDWYNNMVWFSAPGSRDGNDWTKFLDADLNGLNDIYDLVFDDQNNAYIATSNGLYKDPVYRANNTAWTENTAWTATSNGLPPNAKAGVLNFDAEDTCMPSFILMARRAGFIGARPP